MTGPLPSGHLHLLRRSFHAVFPCSRNPAPARKSPSRSPSYYPPPSLPIIPHSRPPPAWPGNRAGVPARKPARIVLSAGRRLHPIVEHKLQTFAGLDPRSIYCQTLAALGLFKSRQPGGSSSWIAQLQQLSIKYSQSVARAICDPQSTSNDLRDLASALSKLPTRLSREANDDLDRAILAHFIPWASTESHRARHAQPPSLRFDAGLVALLGSLAKLIDMRRPQDLYPDARRYKRQIHLHVGPTNSGKTHAALRALHGAHTGVYAGPLRLLAHEVFTRMNAGQIAADLGPRACNLLTGEEQRMVGPSAGLTSCTVEMLSSHQFYDVVVIDEIQMIGDEYRGDAWTQAVLGVQAKEVHLCGEESVVDLIGRLAEACGDVLVVHRYQRLTPLKVSERSLGGDIAKVNRGDCVVAFSRNNIYALKKRIQTATQLRVGMAYGGLPPEVREREAQLFNRGSEVEGEGGYDVLVGSDAIGMGLNLKIKRIIFEALHKFDGRNEIQLSTSQIKQIGGRAGRFGILPSKSDQSVAGEPSTANGSAISAPIGEVMTLQETDMDLLRRCMGAKFEPITKAVIKAPFETVEGLARLAPQGVRYSTLLGLRRSLTVTRPEYAIGDEKNAGLIADALEPVEALSLGERDLFCSAPANSRSSVALAALQAWATAHAQRREVDFEAWLRHENVEGSVEMIELFGQACEPEAGERGHRKRERLHSENLLRLESLHKCLVLYLWLGFRLPETFCSMKLCEQWKRRCEDALALGLGSIAVFEQQD